MDGTVGTVEAVLETFSIFISLYGESLYKGKTIPTVPYLCGIRVCRNVNRSKSVPKVQDQNGKSLSTCS